MAAQTIITRDSDPAGLIARLTMPPAFYKRTNETRFKQEWLLTYFQYLCLRLGWDGEGDPRHWMMSVFKGPKYQRGALSGGSVSRSAPAPQGVVGIANHTILDERFSSGTAQVQWQFLTNGQLWINRASGSNSQPNNEWWSLEPDIGIGPDYEARHISAGKIGTFSSEAAAQNVWITLDGTRNWQVTRNSTGTKSCTATFEVGLDGIESAIDTAVFVATATVDDM